ncbi:glycosyltransferase family 4 protein [Streptomyces sp. TRM66268-LWL]|uniref:Glycosyltransferase family 4 protein n=1 Tax=Streptomyces polyasparticus TaxID=2767826 RepID=A0ABR7SIL9_9ACTN|nr:glycosyltransferase family 4 protein [Streptomyces polyasparticus]MBC9714417.1 glycosyltransferase family 4 protein [Streptomyces polyasparticus]
MTTRRLRIALVHSFYGTAAPSGENHVPLDQAEALRRAGHEVHLVTVATDELSARPLYPVRSALTVIGGRGRSPLGRLRELRPDIVHVHNLFPNYGRTWVRDWQGPLVCTLHNYRALCANAVLYRDGQICTRCPDGDRWAGLRAGCYRDSAAATLPLAWAGRKGPLGDPLLARADRVIVLSELSRATYARAGLPAERMALLPNFVPDRSGALRVRPDRRWVCVGRLTKEKGILDLLRKWPADEPLDVIGNGPQEAECRAVAGPQVRLLGALPRERVQALLPHYTGLVFSSRWFEGAVPQVYGEALAAGVPVVALDGSCVPGAVRAEGTGLTVSWDEPLDGVLREAAVRFPGMRAHCRQVYEGSYAESTWVGRMERLYTGLLAAPRDMEVLV